MLKQIELKDIAVTTESEYVCQGEGEILKVCVEFEDTAKDLTVQIYTKEGEEILNIINQRESDVYYPRVNTQKQRYESAAQLSEAQTLEKFYFYPALYVKFTNQGVEKSKKIKKLLILYRE